MMYDLTVKELSDLLWTKLKELGDEVILKEPDGDAIFPCRVLRLPYMRVDNTINAVPVRKTFQISVEHWSDTQRESMSMADDTDVKLRDHNFIRTNTELDSFDKITKKYRYITRYEVRYNCLTNSFMFIK